MIQIWYETINNLYSCSPLFCFLSTQTILFIYNVTTDFWIGPALQKPNSAFSKRPCCVVTQQAVVLIQLHKTPSQHCTVKKHTAMLPFSCRAVTISGWWYFQTSIWLSFCIWLYPDTICNYRYLSSVN